MIPAQDGVRRGAGSAEVGAIPGFGKLDAVVMKRLWTAGRHRPQCPKPLTDGVIKAADVATTVGCGDTCPIYPGTRYLDRETR